MKKDSIRLNGQRLDQVIYFARERCQTAMGLDDKVELQRLVKALEAVRSQYRQNVFRLEDSVAVSLQEPSVF